MEIRPKLEAFDQIVPAGMIVGAVQLVDPADQIERVDRRQVIPELRLLAEYRPDAESQRLRSRQGVQPSTFASPDDGCRMPVSILIVVDLPAPFGPRNATISPRCTVRSMLRTATFSSQLGFSSDRKLPAKPASLRLTVNTFRNACVCNAITCPAPFANFCASAR